MEVSADIAVAQARRHVDETVTAATAFEDGTNSTYGLATGGHASGFDAIIKFGTADPALVRVEPHVIELLSENDVPVPTVLGIGQYEDVPYFVTNALSGDQPAHAAALGVDRVLGLAHEMGGILGRIQLVEVGVGSLSVDEHGALSATNEPWDSFFRRWLETFARELKGTFPHLGSEAVRLVHWVDMPAIPAEPVITPIDLHTHNLFVANGDVTGVIDFERCYGGHPGWAYAITEHLLTVTRPDEERLRIADALERGYEQHHPSAPVSAPAFALAAVLREMRAARILWEEPKRHTDRLEARIQAIETEIQNTS